MRKLILTMLLLILATPAFGFLGVSGKVEVDSNSKHVYRGVEAGDDNFVIQPNAYLSVMDLRAKIFNNITLDPDGDAKKLDRTDLMLGYSILSVMGFDLTPGVKYYHKWNEGTDNTTEIFLNIDYSISLLGSGVGVYSHHYIDVQNDFGKYYGNVGARFIMDTLPVLGVEGYMDLNWQKPYAGDKVDFVFPYSLNIGVAAKFKPMPLVYLKAHIDMSVLLDEDTKDSLDAAKKDTNIIYFGLAAGLSF